MEPIVYSSQDTGAPQVFMAAGSINAVIKACLVDGYGDKLAAGWDLLDEDLAAHTLTLRSQNPQSNKSVFVISDNNVNTGPNISGYLGWDASTLKPVNEYTTTVGVRNRNSDSRPVSNAQKWVIVANDSFCWFWLASNDFGNYGLTQAFGDLISINPTVQGSCVIGYRNTDYSSTNTNIKNFVSSAGTAYLADQPYATIYPSALGGSSESYSSDVYVLSRQVVHLTDAAGKKAPAFFVPGLLVSAAEIPYVSPIDGTSRRDVGGGLINPIALLRQAYQGYIPISMDAQHWG